MLDRLNTIVNEFAQIHGLGAGELSQVIAWLRNPTIKPIVSVQEFLESPYFMGAKKADGTSILYPKIIEELTKANSGDYDEGVFTGGIGSGKTTCALYTTAYQLYKLSCYDNPHELFQLDPSSEIVFIFQSVEARTAKTVDYQRFRSMIGNSPYFREQFMFDKELESEMIFPKRIIVRPVASTDTSAIGQNVFGGIMDEINFMDVIQSSKRSIDGGVYDQAVSLYNSISKRRKTRFSRAGSLPGMLCLVSSAKYPGQFTDQKLEEARMQLAATGKTSIYIYNKRVWDVKPPEFFLDEKFWVYPGDAAKQPRIILDLAKALPAEMPYLVEVPKDYLSDFQRDVMGSLRDIAGVATLARYPFFIEIDKVSECFGKTKNVFSKPVSTLCETDTVSLNISHIQDTKAPRFAHIDLAISGDSAGLVIGHVSKFIEVNRGGHVIEKLPYVIIDCVLEIPPPPGGEILFYRIRDILYTLRDKAGLPITWVTLDSFQSKDTMQLLHQKGFASGYQSIDVRPDPYVYLKGAIYDGRIEIPRSDKLQKELASLEVNAKNGKIDHPPNGSKDLADALAGVVYGLTNRRMIWAQHGVKILPASFGKPPLMLTQENSQNNLTKAKGVL